MSRETADARGKHLLHVFELTGLDESEGVDALLFVMGALFYQLDKAEVEIPEAHWLMIVSEAVARAQAKEE